MATKRDIKRKINSVLNTKKITNAMKLVATARFAKLNNLLNVVRSYDEYMNQILKCVVESVYNEISHPLYTPDFKSNKNIIIVVSTDRGLCGSINNNLFKFIMNWLHKFDDNKDEQIELICIGRKAIQFFKKTVYPIIYSHEKLLDNITLKIITDMVLKFKDMFLEQKYKTIYVAYSHFISAIQQRPTIIQLFPVRVAEGIQLPENYNTKLIIEPPIELILDELLVKVATINFFRILFEAATAEQGSRMTAMDNATNNAEELYQKFILQYNKVRQASITKELIEITTGAQVR